VFVEKSSNTEGFSWFILSSYSSMMHIGGEFKEKGYCSCPVLVPYQYPKEKHSLHFCLLPQKEESVEYLQVIKQEWH